ncbi:MAG TPA: PAS domain S-box protein, partial [Armatimonadota bacterium]
MELTLLQALQCGTDLGELLAGSIPVALSLSDPDGRLLWYNRRAEGLWGCRPAVASERGRHAGGVAPEPAMVPAHSAVALALMRGERVLGMEETVLRPDGSCRVVVADVELLRDAGGALVGALAAYSDVSQHKELERALLEHSQRAEKEVRRYASLLENCADGIALIGENGALIYLSPSALDITGYAPEELLGHLVGEYVHPDDLAGVQERFAAVKERPGGTLTKEFRFRHKDGSWRRMECRDRNLLHDPAVRAVLTNFSDITDRRELERQVAQSSKMEALGRLAGGVAHDFNNLLTVINGMAEMLLEKTSAEDSRRRSLLMLQTAGERAADLTRQLLAFSRQQVVPAQPLDLKDAVAKVEGMLGRLIGEDIELRTSIGPDPVTVMADPGQV